MEYATRGDFAEQLYALLGMDKPTSTDKFADAGGAASTLMDLGITNGIGEGQYGTDQTVTRGEAFTMIARALGLVDNKASIEQGTQALVNAGIVKGYNNDPNQLGIGDPLQLDHLGILLAPDRVGAALKQEADPSQPGITVLDTLQSKADDARNANIAENDPGFAAFLAEQGIRKSDRQAVIDQRVGQYDIGVQKIQDEYDDQLDDDLRSSNLAWEDRGLHRSGARVAANTEISTDNQRQQGTALFDYQTAHENWLQQQNQQLLAWDREVLERATQAEADMAQKEIEDAYDYTFGI